MRSSRSTFARAWHAGKIRRVLAYYGLPAIGIQLEAFTDEVKIDRRDGLRLEVHNGNPARRFQGGARNVNEAKTSVEKPSITRRRRRRKRRMVYLTSIPPLVNEFTLVARNKVLS